MEAFGEVQRQSVWRPSGEVKLPKRGLEAETPESEQFLQSDKPF